MKPHVYITIPNDIGFLNSLCHIMGNANTAPYSVVEYSYELTINDNASAARITRYVSTRMYPNENEYRVVSNDEFLLLVTIAKKAELFNEL